MSRAQLTPLCGSCRGFLHSTLPQRTTARGLSVIIINHPQQQVPLLQPQPRKYRECFHQSQCRTFSTSLPIHKNPSKSSQNHPPKSKQNPNQANKIKVIWQRPPLVLNLTEASQALASLDTALEKKDANAAWTAFKELSAKGLLESRMVQKLLRKGMTMGMFNLISAPDFAPPQNEDFRPLAVAKAMLENTIATPQMFSQLIVDCFKKGDLWELDSIIQQAARISIPVNTALAHLRGLPHTDNELLEEESTNTIEDPQLELWVLIYCAFTHAQAQDAILIESGDARKPPPFRALLLHALAHIRTLPNETKIKDILTSHGFSQEFQQEILNAASTFESASYFANFRALGEEVRALTNRKDLPGLKVLYVEGKATAAPPWVESHYNLFVRAFASLNHFEAAAGVWNDLLAAGIEPGMYTWNALLMGCGKAKDLKLLKSLWQKMVDAGVVPDTFLWTTRLHALFSAGYIQEGLESLRTMLNDPKSQPNINTINAVIDGLCRNSQFVDAKNILQFADMRLGIRPDVVTYNTLLKGYMGQGNIPASFKCLEDMDKEQIQPDVITCTIILNGLYKHAIRTSANSLQQPTGNSPLPSILTGDPSGDVSSPLSPETPKGAAAAVKAAELLSTTTTQQPQTPESTLFTICSNLLTQMRSSGIEANVQFYTVLIGGLLHPTTQNLSAALDVMRIMQSRGVVPTAATYTVFVRYYLAIGDVAAVEATWREMQALGVPPDHIILEETVKGYARLRADGVRVFREDVVDGMLSWLRRVGELNRSSSSGGSNSAMSKSASTTNSASGDASTDPTPSRPQYDMVYKLSMRTYKEVLGRLVAEELYEFVDDVLEDVVRRLASDGAAARKTNMKQLRGVLKVLGARGIRVPKELREEF